jgi:CRP/FNR family cyclic AMP-dependent transcriptional regulator
MKHVEDEGDVGNAVYFIAEGAVKIEKRIEASGTEAKTLAILGAGDFFGEMSLFDGKPRSAATLALGPTKRCIAWGATLLTPW